MSVFKLHRHDKGFACIDNQTLRDPRISYRARGVLGYLLSQPEHFQASSETLAEHGHEGRDAIRTALKELEACGYILREKIQGPDGRWSTTVHVFEKPNKTDAWENVVGLTGENTTNPQVTPTTEEPTLGEPGYKNLEDERKKTEEARRLDFYDPDKPEPLSDEEKLRLLERERGWARL